MYRKCLPLIVLGLVACGGQESPRSTYVAAARSALPTLAPCSLLTSDDILAATGWSSITSIDSTSSPGCNYRGPNELRDVVAIMVSAGMSAMASSEEMAKWRGDQASGSSLAKFIISPLEEFGVPAIRNELEGAGLITIEAYKSGYLIDITAPTFEISKKLTPTALSRVP